MRRILIAIGVALACRQAAACDCWISDPNRQVERADIVFAGRVTGIDAAPWPVLLPAGHTMAAQPPLAWLYGSRQVSFEIERAIKGTAEHTISLWTGSGGGDCGIDFNPALTYLVLARYDSGHRLIADLCGGTVWLGYSEARTRFRRLLEDFTVSDPEPYDVPMAGVRPPLLIGARFPEKAPMDNFPIVLEIDREGRVSHFSFAFGPDRCFVCCREKREILERSVPHWRFQPATIDGKAVASRIRAFWTIQTTDDEALSERFRVESEWRQFKLRLSPVNTPALR
jgi:hypothetical protein